MAKISKNRKAVLAKYNPEKEYSLEDAAKVLKEITFTKFDASVDLDIRLGVDPKIPSSFNVITLEDIGSRRS